MGNQGIDPLALIAELIGDEGSVSCSCIFTTGEIVTGSLWTEDLVGPETKRTSRVVARLYNQ
jgi:hypothetical protein